MTSVEASGQIPSRYDLLKAVDFIKGEYQVLAQELAEKNIQLEHLSHGRTRDGRDIFEVEMQNYELQSQLNNLKMAHIEEVKRLTMEFNRELESHQRAMEEKYSEDLSRAESRVRWLESKPITASDSDSSMIHTMKQKMLQTEELLSKLSRDYGAAMEQRNQEITRLQQLLSERTSRPSVDTSYSYSVKQQHLKHIAELEHRVGQLVGILNQQETGRSRSLTPKEIELHAALDQSQRLNDQLNVELQECHKRLEKLSVEYDTSAQHELVRSEQLRNKESIISEQQNEMDRLSLAVQYLEGRLVQSQNDKERYLDYALRTTVQKFESKIESLQKQQSEHSNRPSMEPLEYSQRGSEIESELKQLKRRVQDQDAQLEVHLQERDQLLLRNKELEGELAALIQQFKERSQANPPEAELYLQRLREQNHDYRYKFAFLQKYAKRIVDEHRYTIEKLEIALEETNDWNRQLKEQEVVFKREYQLLLYSKEQLEAQLRNAELAHAGNVELLRKQSHESSGKPAQQERLAELYRKLKEAEYTIELNNERLELHKVSRKDSDRKYQELESKARDNDKKLTVAYAKLRKLAEANELLKEELNHKNDEYRKLESHFEAVKARHYQEIVGLQKSFESMNETLVQEKKLYEDKKSALFAEQAAESQRANEHNLKLEAALKQQNEVQTALYREIEAVTKSSKDLTAELSHIRTENSKLEESLTNKYSLIKLKDKRIDELTYELAQAKSQLEAESQDQSLIIADKDRVYEYILELEEKCKLLYGLNTYASKTVAATAKPANGILASENSQLRYQIDRLEKEIVEARLESNRISLEFERHKRQSLQELLSRKQSEEETVQRLYAEIESLNALVGTNRRLDRASFAKPQTPQFSVGGASQHARPAAQSLIVSSLQSPLNFNTLPERTPAPGFQPLGLKPNLPTVSFRYSPVDAFSLRKPNDPVIGSSFCATFGRRS